MSQPELPMFQAEPEDEHVRAFVRLLSWSGEWLTASEVLTRLGHNVSESSRRLVRTWAEAAGDEVVSGQLGYRHADRATPDEIHHCASWLDSQGDKMKLRAARIRARAHGRVG